MMYVRHEMISFMTCDHIIISDFHPIETLCGMHLAVSTLGSVSQQLHEQLSLHNLVKIIFILIGCGQKIEHILGCPHVVTDELLTSC